MSKFNVGDKVQVPGFTAVRVISEVIERPVSYMLEDSAFEWDDDELVAAPAIETVYTLTDADFEALKLVLSTIGKWPAVITSDSSVKYDLYDIAHKPIKAIVNNAAQSAVTREVE